MKLLWSFFNSKNLKPDSKVELFLTTTTILSGLIGLFIWYILHFIVLNTVSWAICFAGYSAFFGGLIGGTLFLFNQNV